MEKIILASASPRRRELMALITPDFEIISADVEEILPEDIYPEEASEYLAELKCRHISKSYPDRTVIGCDTTVLVDGTVLGKPRDGADAYDMLKKLSGKTHLVITGVCICRGERLRKFSQISEVEFYELTDDEINEYISTSEPFDKAGSYGIQGFGGLLVKSIRGDYNNIVGLPAARLKRELEQFEAE